MENKNKKMYKRIGGGVGATIGLIALTTAIICAISFTVYIAVYIKPRAEINLANLDMNFSSVVYYTDTQTGEYKEFEKLHGSQNRIWADMEEIPKSLGEAFVSIEDERFYKHNGVDWKRTFAAAVNWIIPVGSKYGGGSTITQQLVKNITSDNDFSVVRKLLEIFRALDIERKLEKDEILEYYMNTVYFGRNAYGVRTAAVTYFGKDVSELSLAQCAVIAGITNNPSLYDPFAYPENIKKRQELILDNLLKHKKITAEECAAAKAEPLNYVSIEQTAENNEPQSYFIDEVMNNVIDDLVEQKGYSKQVATNMVYSGGLQIYSTVDPKVQSAMETVFESDKNVPGKRGKNGKYPEAAMVILDPFSGEVRGIVGGKGEKEGSRVLNRATQTYRAPGSSIKPIAVYGPAIDQGVITPYSVLTDMPQDVLGGKLWPINSTNGGDYAGQMTANFAVEQSINTVAIDVLKKLTPDKSFEYLTQKLGLKELIAKQTTSNGKIITDIAIAPLALGGLTKGVTVMEMAAAYAPFLNDGIYTEPKTYTKVLDADGEVLLENKPKTTLAFQNEKTSYYVTHMLKNVVTNGVAKQANLGRIDTAGKTGSTSENNDRWFVGYTPYYVGATWYGYDEQQRVSGAGANPSATLWKMVMDIVHKDLPNKKFPTNNDFLNAQYCADSGLKPNEWCALDVRGTRVRTGYYHKSDVPTEICNIHKSIKIDKVTKMQATEFCPETDTAVVGIMDLTRLFKTQATLRDGDFAITIDNAPIGSGVPTVGTGGAKYGTICTVHNHLTAPETNPEDIPVEPGTEEIPGTEETPGEVVPENPTSPIEPIKPITPIPPSEKPDNSGQTGETGQAGQIPVINNQ